MCLADDGVWRSDDARIRAAVEYLASDELAGREGPDAIRAGKWVADQFNSIGLKALFGESFLQEIPDKDGNLIGVNVAGIVAGADPELRDEYVIVSGHHDHLGTRNGAVFYGANDNASAVAMVLESARAFAEKPGRRTTVFVSFDLEENMLWGSRYFVANPVIPLEQISLFMTADMLGRPLGDLPLESVFVMGGETAQPLSDVLASQSEAVGQSILRLGADIVGTRSDYGPFRNEKVPFLFFSTGENPDYHSPRDTAARLDFDLVRRNTDLMIAVARDVAERDEKLAWTGQPPSDVSDAATLLKVCELVTAEVEAGRVKLGVVEKLLVSQTLDRTRQIVERGSFEPGDRAWLVRAAQGMLLTVF